MTKVAGIADAAGVTGAILAAVCCAGAPMILSVLSAVGLSFLRNDKILLPAMGISLAIALWSFWRARQIHGAQSPLLLAIVSSGALVAGVVFIHGYTARVFIALGAIGLVIATVLNVGLKVSIANRDPTPP